MSPGTSGGGRVASFPAARSGIEPLPFPSRRNPVAAEAARVEFARFGEQIVQPLPQAAGGPPERRRTPLYKALLHLQRQFFFLAAKHQLSFDDLRSLYEAYRDAYRTIEDMLYALDMEPAPPIAPPGAVPEAETPEPLGIEIEDGDDEETE